MSPPGPEPLNRELVLSTAVKLADEVGYDGLSMRTLAERLGVVPMALYKHVSNKDELLDGMVERIIAEIDEPAAGTPASDWKARARERVLSARRTMQRHPWAWQAIETRTLPGPAALDHMEGMIRTLREGGLSATLVHQFMHALGSRLWGFTQEVYAAEGPPEDPEALAAAAAMMAQRWPYIVESATAVAHDSESVVGPGCDDEAEFRFALDLLLDGAERLHEQGW